MSSTSAASGREAVEMARATPYDIYFLDLKMPPGIGGIETMIEIRKLQPEATVVIITAYATVDTAINALKEGAQEYMVKPCNPEEISLFVKRTIEVKNLQRENLVPAPAPDAALFVPGHHQQEPGDARDLRPGQGSGQPAQHGPDPGRQRHRQGTGGAGAARGGRARGAAVRGRVLRGAGRDAAGVRAVRAREGRLHRAPWPASAASSRRPAAARSSWTRSATSRPSCRWTCCACCRSGSSSGWAAPRRSPWRRA